MFRILDTDIHPPQHLTFSSPIITFRCEDLTDHPPTRRAPNQQPCIFNASCSQPPPSQSEAWPSSPTVVSCKVALDTYVEVSGRCIASTDGHESQICTPDGSTVQYCQNDKSPRQVDSQYCDYGDCRANQEQGFCQAGIYGSRNIARGPTDCSQVNADGGKICSPDYTTIVSSELWSSSRRAALTVNLLA